MADGVWTGEGNENMIVAGSGYRKCQLQKTGYGKL